MKTAGSMVTTPLMDCVTTVLLAVKNVPGDYTVTVSHCVVTVGD